MARTSRRACALAFILLAGPLATAQLSSVPDLSTATNSASASPTSNKNSAKTTSSTDNAASTSFVASTGTDTNAPFHLTGLPTIAGAGIPTLVVPYTANAPYMRKSSLPQGTFFIAVGAVLAFFGGCVLLWRIMVAWSVNRSVRRTAMMASGGGSEKNGGYSGWGGSSRKSSGYNPVGTTRHTRPSSGYKDYAAKLSNSVSLENLTSAGKSHKSKPMRPSSGTTASKDLFFSPTAQGRESAMSNHSHRTPGYMPTGFYASPSAQAPANTTVGGGNGSIAPYARNAASPPPGASPHSRGSTTLRGSYGVSRDGYGGGSRDSYLAAPISRQGARSPTRNSMYGNNIYAQPSNSSLMVGQSTNSEPSTRAPSAYLEDLFDQHGGGMVGRDRI